MKKLVEGQGAKFCTTVTGDCTHFVTTQREVDNNNSKCKFFSDFLILVISVGSVPIPRMFPPSSLAPRLIRITQINKLAMSTIAILSLSIGFWSL